MSEQDVKIPEVRGDDTAGDDTTSTAGGDTDDTQASEQREDPSQIESTQANPNKQHQVEVWGKRIDTLEKAGKYEEADSMRDKLADNKAQSWILDELMVRETQPTESFDDQADARDNRKKHNGNIEKLTDLSTANHNLVVKRAKEIEAELVSLGANKTKATVSALEKALKEKMPEIEKSQQTNKERVSKGQVEPSALGKNRTVYTYEEISHKDFPQAEYERVMDLKAKGEVDIQ